MTLPVLVKNLGLQPYEPVWQEMQQFTRQRERPSQSQIWVLQHTPVYTQGQAGKPEHILDHGDIPVVQSDRGGQVTYHGPGQLILYPLLDLHELKTGVRSLVQILENTVIAFLQDYDIDAYARREAPGVYIREQKIAALGLRIRKGFSYHGLSFNIDMDLTPFQQINPCGYRGLEVTQLKEQGVIMTPDQVADKILHKLANQLQIELQFNE